MVDFEGNSHLICRVWIHETNFRMSPTQEKIHRIQLSNALWWIRTRPISSVFCVGQLKPLKCIQKWQSVTIFYEKLTDVIYIGQFSADQKIPPAKSFLWNSCWGKGSLLVGLPT